jgi:predicted amino acid-binding ACT domain protein
MRPQTPSLALSLVLSHMLVSETYSSTLFVTSHSPPSLPVGIDENFSNFAFKPQGGYVLTFKNEDKPGSVLQVLDLLHAGNVNIANINVVRAKESLTAAPASPLPRVAVTLMSLDNDIPNKIMNQIRNLSHLEDVAKIRLI